MSRLGLLVAGALWLALLGLTLALTFLAARHDTLPGDVGITTWAQGLAFPGEDFSDTVRAVVSTEVVLATGAAIALVLWLRGYRRQAILLAVGLVLLPLLAASIKDIVDRPRPSAELVDLRASFSSPSFPSGHVMSGTYLYGFLLYLSIALTLATTARWALGALSLFILVFNGPANVYLGVHWPSDVLGGYACALLLLGPLVVADRAARMG
ncbi:MAG: phosphatase PAP2 family protein [Chloroflexi bacterium]|nr:phosphatase PAP2 family protein [Chloroflexota bacterium]